MSCFRSRWLACLALLCSGLAAAGDGVLDPGFGGGGSVATPYQTFVSSLATQPDGKVVALGITNSPAVPVLLRFMQDGSLDAAFDGGGPSRLGVGTDAPRPGIVVLTGAGMDFFGQAVAVQPDGKLVVVGAIPDSETIGNLTNLYGLIAVARFLDNGAPDHAFGNNGVVTTRLHTDRYPNPRITGLALHGDGRIVVAGWDDPLSSLQHVFVARYSKDGRVDDTFGVDGVATFERSRIGMLATGAPVVQADSKVLLPGGFDGKREFVVARFTASGALDPAFGEQGVSRTVMGQSGEGRIDATSVAVHPSGAIVVGGHVGTSGPPSSRRPLRDDFAIVRLTGDGRADPSFGSAGRVINPRGEFQVTYSAHSTATNGNPTAVVLQPDGRIVQAGAIYDGIGLRGGLARYAGNGARDPTFGQGGNVVASTTTPFFFAQSVAAAMTTDATRLYLAGYGPGVPVVSRYLLAATPGSIELSASTYAANPGQAVTLDALVTPAASGYVRFLADTGGIAGCDAVPLVPAGNASRAVCTVTLGPGTHSVVAAYLGSTTRSPDVSDEIRVTEGRFAETIAVEYVSPLLGGYFMTTSASEIAILDATSRTIWQRTGRSFTTLDSGAPRAKSFCRFYSADSFAPMSSHFFSASDLECALVGPEWKLEGFVMRVAVVPEAGFCPKGLLSLYRLFNNGKGGAPHHRYTTDPALRTQLVGEGWAAEGVVACVPYSS